MSAGLNVINQSSELVIDENYKNLQLLRKINLGDITTVYTFQDSANNKSVPTTNYRYGAINYWFGYAMFVIYMDENEVFVTGRNKSTNTCECLILPNGYARQKKYVEGYYTTGVSAKGVEVRVPTSQISNTELYFWGYKSVTKDDGFGLQVFDGKGKIIFSGVQKHLKVLGMGNTEISFPEDGRKISVANFGANIYASSNASNYGGSGYGEFSSFFKYKDGKITKQIILLQDQTGYYVSNLNASPFYIIIDVSKC